mgnify:FL=1
MTAEEVLPKPFLSSGKKKLPHRFSGKTELPVFNLTHFYWLPAYFRKCSEAQIIRGCISMKLNEMLMDVFFCSLGPFETSFYEITGGR